jgi:hypothetical protein
MLKVRTAGPPPETTSSSRTLPSAPIRATSMPSTGPIWTGTTARSCEGTSLPYRPACVVPSFRATDPTRSVAVSKFRRE